jgi:hypothetical protein
LFERQKRPSSQGFDRTSPVQAARLLPGQPTIAGYDFHPQGHRAFVKGRPSQTQIQPSRDRIQQNSAKFSKGIDFDFLVRIEPFQ